MATNPRIRRLSLAALLAVLFLQIAATFGPVQPAAASSACASGVHSTTEDAQDEFADRCGRAWNDQVRDQCTWVGGDPAGWVCHEYTEGTFVPTTQVDRPEEESAVVAEVTTPWFIQAEWANGYVNVVWNHRGLDVDGVNIYRDGEYVGTVTDGNVYNDYSGRPDSVYHLVGFKDGLFSDPSADFTASSGVDVVLSVQDRGNGTAALAWIVSGYQPGQTPYRSLYRILPDGNGGARVELAKDTRGLHTTSGVNATVPTISRGDLYVVLIQHGGDVVAVSGVQSLDGNVCVANCDGELLANLDAPMLRNRKPSRAEIIRQIVERVGQVIDKCKTEACGIDKVADYFNTPDTAEVAGDNAVADAEQDGWSISSQDGNTTTLTQGPDTLVIEAVPGSGVVTTTQVEHDGPLGQMTSVEVETTSYILSPNGENASATGVPQRTVVVHRYSWMDGSLLGSYAEQWRNGQLIRRDCYGSSGSTQCTTQAPLRPAPGTGGDGNVGNTGDGGCYDNDCQPGNGPTTVISDPDPSCSDNDCDNTGQGGNVGNGNSNGESDYDNQDDDGGGDEDDDDDDDEEEEEEEETETTENPHTR